MRVSSQLQPLSWSIMSHTKEQTCPDESQFLFYVVRCIFQRNVHTDYFEPRKSLPVDFPKSEKENFFEEIATPWDKMRYKVTHTTTHTVFQIDNWAKRFLSVLSRHICEQISIICPRNFTAISWGVDLNEKLFLAKTPRSGVTNQWCTRIRPFYKPDNIATKQV